MPVALTDTAWNNPTPDTGLAIPRSDTAAANPWKGQNFYGGHTEAVDPRLDWTVGRDGVPFKDWGVHKRNWIRDASYSGPYSPKKNIHEDAADAETNAGWNPSASNDVNIHIFRYADMLLLLAEAEVEVGTLANALAIVNQIRARAGQVAQGCGSADSTVTNRYASCVGNTSLTVPLVPAGTLDTVTTPWAAYRIGLYPSFPTQAYARTAVRYERRLELAMEGQRFFDLRRWGAADTTLNKYLTRERTRITYLGSAAVFSARHALYPIPDIQVQLSRVGGQDRLVQNPGW